ncbi:hypothetical protein MBLNU13_g10495t1 [Cladosporium sp. NU13]
MAITDHDTDSTDSEMQNITALAMSKLNRQRIYQLNIAAEGQGSDDLSDCRKVNDAQKAREAVEALQKALYVFAGMSDEQAATFQVLHTLLAPLDLPEASDEDVKAWRDSRLRINTNVEQGNDDDQGHPLAAPLDQAPNETIHALQQAAQAQPSSSGTSANVSTSGPTDSPAPSQAHDSNGNDPLLPQNTKPPKEQKTWTRDSAGVEYLTVSSTIIKLEDGTFVELRCDICQGNSSWAYHKFNSGVRGFQSHFRQIHDVKTSAETVLQRCTHRVVSSQEVEQLISGDSKIPFISSKQKVDVESGKDYIGNTATVGPVTKSRVGNTVEILAAAGQTQAATSATPKKTKKNNDGQCTGPAAATPRTSNRVRDVTAPCLSNCLVVVKTTAEDGTDKYHELRCDFCGGNGSYGSGKLLEGVKGFKAHFRQIHHEQLLTADVLRRCSFRELPIQEVHEIQSGNVNIGFIRCEGSVSVRPKKSYKNFNTVERT